MNPVNGMPSYPDKHFDLAIVDPPYGLGKRTTDGGTLRNTQTKFMQDIRRTNWDDNKPTAEYFTELFRVSQNQIICGGNYFDLPPTRCFIVWDKMTYPPTMSQVEYLWTSFDSPARLKQINSNDANRMHPTQKPIALYKWLLTKYAVCKTCSDGGEEVHYADKNSRENIDFRITVCPNCKGNKARILDTHVGSASSLIACEDMGFSYVGYELDTDYYNSATKRLENFRKQLKLFNT